MEDLHLPDTIQAVIRSRVDRLDPDSRETLRLASVIGREFARSVLAQLFLAEARLSRPLRDTASQQLGRSSGIPRSPARSSNEG